MSARDIVQLTCKEVVELVVGNQLDAMDTAARVTLEQHLFGCTWCMTYLKQVDRAVELTAQLRKPPETPPHDAEELSEKLGALFRARKPTK